MFCENQLVLLVDRKKNGSYTSGLPSLLVATTIVCSMSGSSSEITTLLKALHISIWILFGKFFMMEYVISSSRGDGHTNVLMSFRVVPTKFLLIRNYFSF